MTSSNGVVEIVDEESATANNGTVTVTDENGNGATDKNGNGSTDEKPWYKKPVVWGITGGGLVAITAAILLLRR